MHSSCQISIRYEDFFMLRSFRLCQTIALTGLLTLWGTSASACTGITIRPADGSVVFARTMEFGIDLRSNVIIVPRGHSFEGTAPGGKPGMQWTSKFGIVGTNAFDEPLIADGLNEKGLHVGLFYFPGFAKYQEVKSTDAERTLAPWELCSYLLGMCGSVDEAVEAANHVLVGEVVMEKMGFVPPLHLVATDSSGESMVFEYVDGKLNVHANPLGVVTNSPPFDWHMTNLRNYINLTPQNSGGLDLAGNKIEALGQGSGMLGLPGDFTPPSRFVRAVAYTQSALPVETAEQGVLQAFHLLNQFDIPKGAATSTENGKEVADYTLWTNVVDLKNLRHYFRTYENSQIRMVDLQQLDFDAKTISTVSMRGDEVIEDLSKTAK
ncbi:Choloylglycine hydrolase [Rhodopirellula islandica]|uniref:Choloylglycine hydrolase n=1 Tax=Rhodopirellula islandica TaxID=595434 RepID=A0A0J1BIH9_RHOIS|nr:Choloylglycine hydrolase [Rhodopirellula islandica]